MAMAMRAAGLMGGARRSTMPAISTSKRKPNRMLARAVALVAALLLSYHLLLDTVHVLTLRRKPEARAAEDVDLDINSDDPFARAEAQLRMQARVRQQQEQQEQQEQQQQQRVKTDSLQDIHAKRRANANRKTAPRPSKGVVSKQLDAPALQNALSGATTTAAEDALAEAALTNALKAGGGIDDEGFGDGDGAESVGKGESSEEILQLAEGFGVDVSALMACCPKDTPADTVCTCDSSALSDLDDEDAVTATLADMSPSNDNDSAEMAVVNELTQELMPDWAVEALEFRTSSEMQEEKSDAPTLVGVLVGGAIVDLPGLDTLLVKRNSLLPALSNLDSRSRKRVTFAYHECMHETKEAVMQTRHETVDQRRELWRHEAIKALVRSGIPESKQEEADVEDLLDELMQDADARGQSLPEGAPIVDVAQDGDGAETTQEDGKKSGSLTSPSRVAGFFENCFYTSAKRELDELETMKEREKHEMERREAERVAKEAMEAERRRQEEERKKRLAEERKRIEEEQRRIKAVAAERASSLAKAVCEERRRDTLERGESAIAKKIDPLDPDAFKKVQAARLARAEAVMQLCMAQFHVAREEVVNSIDTFSREEQRERERRTKEREVAARKREKRMRDVDSVALAAELEVLEATRTFHDEQRRKYAESARSRREKLNLEWANRDVAANGGSSTRRGGGGDAKLRGGRKDGSASVTPAAMSEKGEAMSLQEETVMLKKRKFERSEGALGVVKRVSAVGADP